MNDLLRELEERKDTKRAESSLWFFKTLKGEYGYGDKFLGIRVPFQRKIAHKYYKNISLDEIKKLMKNPYHEVRLTTLFILYLKYSKGDNKEKEEIVDIYLNNTKYINNWDLVDSSASYILGDYCYHNNREDILIQLSNSNHLWEERISMISTFYYIDQNQYDLSLQLIAKFLTHKHDLIHKACGWVLREIGKKDISILRDFLEQYASIMPRIELSYATEKMSKEERKYFQNKKR